MAGFIGRTNFVERDGGTYSIRPQAIGLSAARPAANAVEADIVGRSYLGEYWDYQAQPLGETKPLRVSTGPNALFARRPAGLAGDRSRRHGTGGVVTPKRVRT